MFNWLPWRKKDVSFSDDSLPEVLKSVFGGGAISKSGASVNWNTALQVSTVLACARVIAEGLAQVPLKIFREEGRSRLPARDHALYQVLHRRPNPWMTSFELRETMGLHAALTGNAYAFTNRVGRERRIAEIIPLEPSNVTLVRAADFSVSYKVRGKDGEIREFPAEAIWHWKGPSWSGASGLDAVKLAREAIGLALSTEEHHAKLHANGARAGGVLSVEGTLSEQQYKQLREFVEKNHQGATNAWRTMILDRNAKWLSTAMNGVDSQHLETRRYQVEEICRFFRVMPIMVGYSDKASTYASAEQMFLAHVVHTLSPWYERIEQSIDCFLLGEAALKAGYYAKFVVAGLLRGALKDTAEYLSKLTTNGILTRNEAREKLEYNPLDGLDDPLTPANMTVGAEPSDPEKEGALNGA